MHRFNLLRRFRLQYASNLFAYRSNAKPEKFLETGLAPNLALLGNVVSTETAVGRHKSREFLSFCADNWKQTLIVPAHSELGCHGTHHASWTDLLDELRELAKEINGGASGKVSVLDQGSLEFSEGIRILGFTGWSAWSRQATSPKELAMPTIYGYNSQNQNMLDLITTTQGHELNREDMEWLDRELRMDTQTPTLLLSHGLSIASLVKEGGLPPISYRLTDLMTFYPFPFLFSRERCIKACLGGAGIGATTSGVIGGRFHAVNAYKPYPTAPISKGYRRDAVYEYSWRDDAEGDVRELVEKLMRKRFSFLQGVDVAVPVSVVSKIERGDDYAIGNRLP